MHAEQRHRTHALLKERGIDRALFAKLESVKWLTGFAPPFHTGPHLFEGGPAVVWYEDGHFTLIVVDSFASQAAGFDQEADGSVITYPGYTVDQPIASGQRLTEALQLIAGRLKGG